MYIEQAYRILPVYTADVSGVCSALFELGGMTVMHDPSGCNSTYNTHDETRWYDRDSLIFISGLTEIDAVMGNDRKLLEDVKAAALRLHPAFIALCGSPVPWLNGTDFGALARLLERETRIPAFAVDTNGAHDYIRGAGNAFLQLARRFVGPAGKRQKGHVNILGMTPLDFAAEGTENTLRQVLETAGFAVQSCWAMGSPLQELQGAACAGVNLVVSAAGLKTARYLEQEYGIPYVAGLPAGAFRETLLKELAAAEADGKSRISCRDRRGSLAAGETVTFIGEPVVMGSLAAALERSHGCRTRLLSPLEDCELLLKDTDLSVRGEDALAEALAGASHIVADPLYRPVCPQGSILHELPHWAFSGRSYMRRMPELVTMREGDWMKWE